MSMPNNQIQGLVAEAWRTYLDSLQIAMDKLDKDINEAEETAGIYTDEWYKATEYVIDELADSLFAISEPCWANSEDTKKLKKLKKRVYVLYADYKGVYKAASA